MHKVKLTPEASDHLVESYCAYNRRPYFNLRGWLKINQWEILPKVTDFELRVQNPMSGWWNFPIKIHLNCSPI